MITLKGLSFHYPGNPQNVLKDINLEIQSGEFVALVGPSGCGKSTLGLALGGFLFSQYGEYVTGSVQIGGKDARTAPLYEIADIVGLVQQNPESQFCTLTVQDELVFGLENRLLSAEEIRQRIEWAMELTGSRHLLHRQLATLSGGEKQKIAIAAMLAGKPQVLIFDEPTSNLDPSATAEIFRVIAGVRAQTAITLIVIEHKLNFLRPYQPRVIEMRDGAITGDLPVADWRPPEINIPHMPAQVNPEVCLAELEGASAGYGEQLVLKDIQFRLHPGEFVALMGDNGSGKTTLLQLLMGFIKPCAGRVLIGGADTHGQRISQIARLAGYVFQNPVQQLFASSVWQEATFALKNFAMLDAAHQDYTTQLLQNAGLAQRLHDHPFRLSYGQMRRLNLVSVFSYQPQLYLLDEILIGQDTENAIRLLELLRQQTRQGAAVVMVNHHPEAALWFATRIVFLSAGRILFDLPTGSAFTRLKQLGYQQYLPADTQAAQASR